MKTEPKKIIQSFIQFRGKGVLIVSYETQRRFTNLFLPKSSVPKKPSTSSALSGLGGLTGLNNSNVNKESNPIASTSTTSAKTQYSTVDLLICDEVCKISYVFS